MMRRSFVSIQLASRHRFALNVTWSGYLVDQIALAEGGDYKEPHVAIACSMSTLKIAALLYLIQAAIGFAIGFAIPWLQFS
jgi:hypothetical protein